MKNSVLIFLFSMLSLSVLAQSGQLKINVYSAPNGYQFTADYPRVRVYNERVTKDFTVEEFSTEEYDVTLPGGTYTVDIYWDEDYVAQSARNVEINSGLITYLSFNGYNASSDYFDDGLNGYDSRWYYSATLNLQTGSDFINNNPNFNGNYSFGYNFDFFYSLGKHVAIGPLFGTQFEYTYFNKDAYIDTTFYHRTERYFYWNLNAGFVLRFSTYNGLTGGFYDNGGILDLGMKYNLPLIFRHVMDVNGKTRTQTRGIHEYTDVTAFARIGHNMISAIAEYRITDFVRDGYPEPPKFRIGLSWMIPYD